MFANEKENPGVQRQTNHADRNFRNKLHGRKSVRLLFVELFFDIKVVTGKALDITVTSAFCNGTFVRGRQLFGY